jgi:hypothetical protein
MPSQSLSRPSQTSAPVGVHAHVEVAQIHSGPGGQSIGVAQDFEQMPVARQKSAAQSLFFKHRCPNALPVGAASAFASTPASAGSGGDDALVLPPHAPTTAKTSTMDAARTGASIRCRDHARNVVKRQVARAS